MDSVLVTGANGHLGFNLTKLLVEKGYRVRAAVRNARNEKKIAHIRRLDAEIVEADILDPRSLRRVMKGVRGVFQVAAVYNLAARDPAWDVQYPIVTGARNVLAAARDASVEKVVFTSSTTAVGATADEGAALSERDWNQTAIEPYAQAKTRAEREAWSFAQKFGLNLVTILPAAILGPGFYRHTPTTQSFEQLLRGKIPFALPLNFSFVDVRDVAQAHVLAYERNNANGRYIASSHYCSLSELFQLAQDVDPEINAPASVMSKKMLWAAPALDWINHVLTKSPRFATRAFVQEYAGKKPRFTNEKLWTELEWRPIPIRQSIADTVTWIKREFICPQVGVSGV